MSRINAGRVILGGLVAGLVLNVIDYLVNGVWLAPQWMAAASKLGTNAMAPTAIMGYVVGDFIFSLLIVWFYAAMRPRFGAGAGTAVKASLGVWVISATFGCQMVLQGLYPGQLVATSSICTLVGMLIAGNLGGMLYKE
jgi:hypothetical protein